MSCMRSKRNQSMASRRRARKSSWFANGCEERRNIMRNGKPKKKQPSAVERSCGNVFADLGFPNAEELLLHAKLVSRLSDVIDKRGLSQAKAAALLGVRRQDLVELLSGDL